MAEYTFIGDSREAGDRHGRRVTFTCEAETLDEVLDGFRDFLLGMSFPFKDGFLEHIDLEGPPEDA